MIFTVCQSSLWRRNITITLVYNFISLNSCCYTFFSCFNIVSTANYGFNWNNRKHRNSRYNTFGAFLLWKLWRIFFLIFKTEIFPPRKAAMGRNLVKKLSILSPLTNYYNSKETGTLLWTKHDAFFFQFTFLTARHFLLVALFFDHKNCSVLFWPSSSASNSNPCLLWIITINLFMLNKFIYVK